MNRNRKGLAILMRTRMKKSEIALPHPKVDVDDPNGDSSGKVLLQDVKEWMRASISVPGSKSEPADVNLEDFSQGYIKLPQDGRRQLLLSLSREYDVSRARVRELMLQYLSFDLESSTGNEHCSSSEQESGLAALYRTEKNLRDALKPTYAAFFERLNAHPGGLKLLVVLRADLLSLLAKENTPSIRSLESYLKEKLITWLSPAALELHQITWDDSASLLEKIVAYEAVHPIRSLLDLKRRLSVGRRCFGYLHPAIPGEPLIFIEVALLKEMAKSIQEVLWDDPPIPESAASCALFYSISSTQAGLSGINLGKFLIKRVVELLRREMPDITVFATLSPIPGFMQWLLSKLASQLKLAKLESDSAGDLSKKESCSTFKENILLQEEEKAILDATKAGGESATEVLHDLLISTNREWTKSNQLLTALQPLLMRLCARYVLKEKKRGKALDAVANFHLQNGAMVERLNWMGDNSEKGIQQSGGIMVNYVYRLDEIEENAQSYFSTGHINASSKIHQYLR
ncbi:malonyl-CoA decarboxylase, mitochondrial [Asparagus officinalis]|uniref:malonyl-CoA decarboxylase, mitochondrial n=1 Tax=Asparagus officinalis TaxID=4686 RepID=UPI00098E342A|nr:malonyl-CoA decarboxylase, mitochondrial [Asparagus officinalis]